MAVLSNTTQLQYHVVSTDYELELRRVMVDIIFTWHPLQYVILHTVQYHTPARQFQYKS